jgi:hypothetical protein
MATNIKQYKKQEGFSMLNKTMLITFPDGEDSETTIRKIQGIMEILDGGEFCPAFEPDEDIDPANIRFCFASDEDDKLLPY